jgi:cell shape-determining protein MreC
LLAIAAISFCIGLAYGFQTPREDKRPASRGYVNDLVARLQEQVDETRRATWDKARVKRDIEELKAKVAELKREVNELDVAVRALGREQ